MSNPERYSANSEGSYLNRDFVPDLSDDSDGSLQFEDLDDLDDETSDDDIHILSDDDIDDPDELLDEDFDFDDLEEVSADDPVGIYFKQMGREPLLTAEQEVSLGERIKRGRNAQTLLEIYSEEEKSDRWRRHQERLINDAQAAREHLSRANTRLVVSVAKRYIGQGLPFPDLIQEGNTGLMRAVDKFDYKRGNRFSTYGTWWIRQAITRAIAQKTRTMRIPLHMTERIRVMYRTAQSMEQHLGRRPTIEEIAIEMNVEQEVISSMMNNSQHAISLERPIGDDGESEFGDLIEDRDNPSPVEVTHQHLLQERLHQVLRELSKRQAEILTLRYGLNGGEPHTLEEIANKYGLSRERIRQLEKEALRKLRHPRFASDLKDYL